MFVTVLPESNRQGTYTSGSVLGAVIPAVASELTIRALMSKAVRDDPTLSMSFHVYKSRDGGQSWQHDTGGTWVGGSGFVGRDGVVNPPITIRFSDESLEGIKAALVRVECDIPTPMRVGVEAELL